MATVVGAAGAAAEAASGVGATAATGATAAVSVVIFAVLLLLLFVVHPFVVLAELGTVVGQKIWRLTRWYNWRGWRRNQLPVRDQRLLQLQQLSHEIQVRRDDGSGQLDQLVSFRQRDRFVSHDVRYRDGRTATDTGLTVQQHGGALFPSVLDKIKGLLEVLLDVLMGRIAGGYLFVLQARFELAGGRLLAGNVQHTVRTNRGRVDGVPAISEQQMGEHV